MSGSDAKNLAAISQAIDQHNSSCPFPASEVRMNPYEVERLGWDEIRGLPVVPDAELGTGRFRIVCSREGGGVEIDETEAIGSPVEVPVEVPVPVGPVPSGPGYPRATEAPPPNACDTPSPAGGRPRVR